MIDGRLGFCCGKFLLMVSLCKQFLEDITYQLFLWNQTEIVFMHVVKKIKKLMSLPSNR